MVVVVINMSSVMWLLIISIMSFLIGCASGDMSRHFLIKLHRDSTDIVFKQLSDSLPFYDFMVKSIRKDTLIASSYIRQGSLNEREILLSFIHQQGKNECAVFVQTITYFRQDTIIEYYDEQKGFPASYRRDFMPIIQLAERIGKQTIRKKK